MPCLQTATRVQRTATKDGFTNMQQVCTQSHRRRKIKLPLNGAVLLLICLHSEDIKYTESVYTLTISVCFGQMMAGFCAPAEYNILLPKFPLTSTVLNDLLYSIKTIKLSYIAKICTAS